MTKKTKPHPISAHVKRELDAVVTQASLCHPNDGLKYELSLSHDQGTASWSHSKLGHSVVLYDFLHTLDSDSYLHCALPHKRHRMINTYAEMMCIHEVKGHGSLSTRELPLMGRWCVENGIHPDLLNIMEDIRIEAALSQKRPGHTKSKGIWIDHTGAWVEIPTTAEGGDYGWRKAYWHRYNAMPIPHHSPEHYLSALCWAERIRKLEVKVHAEFTLFCGKHTLPESIWGKYYRPDIQKFIIRIFGECRNWRKYRTTESLRPLLLDWIEFFPTPPEGSARVAGRNDVIINILERGEPLVDPWGNPIEDSSSFVPTNPSPTGGSGEETTDEKTAPTPVNPKPDASGGGEDRDESGEAPEPERKKGEHEKLSEGDGTKCEQSHDEQTVDLGDGASSELTMETHVVDAPINVTLPAWVSDFAKRDSDFGSSDEKLPADFF